MEVLFLLLLGIPALYGLRLFVTGLTRETREGAITGIAGAAYLGLSATPIVFYLF